MSNNYISNKEFYALLVSYKEKCAEAEKENKPRPKIPDEVARCFLLLATRLSTKSNFSGYTYKDEMVGDGVENCIMACHNFDPEQSQNPFAYFTQIIWYAFLRRIKSEKRHTYVKYKALEHQVLEDILNDEDNSQFENFQIENEKMKPIIQMFEKKPSTKKSKKGLEKIMENVNESETDQLFTE